MKEFDIEVKFSTGFIVAKFWDTKCGFRWKGGIPFSFFFITTNHPCEEIDFFVNFFIGYLQTFY